MWLDTDDAGSRSLSWNFPPWTMLMPIPMTEHRGCDAHLWLAGFAQWTVVDCQMCLRMQHPGNGGVCWDPYQEEGAEGGANDLVVMMVMMTTMITTWSMMIHMTM